MAGACGPRQTPKSMSFTAWTCAGPRRQRPPKAELAATKKDIHFWKIATAGDKKQIFGMKSQERSSILPLRWEDGQFSVHLSVDKLKRPALAGRWRRGCVRQRVRSHHVQGLRAVALDKPKDRKSSGTSGWSRVNHWIKVKNRQHPAMDRVAETIR